MSRLKDENVRKCLSLLREFIDGASGSENKKGAAAMAIEHLQKITAGTMKDSASWCTGRPRVDGTPTDGS